MTLLTHEAQEKVVSLLISEGLVSREKIKEVNEEIAKTKQPLLATLTAKKITDAETISHATAVVMNVPYVNLRNVMIDVEILSLLPYDVVSRTMVVPLGEKNGQLYIAMLDVSNVQQTDYLSQLTQKTIRIMMASEEGLKSAIAQYRGDFKAVERAVKTTEEADVSHGADVKIITQDSPISKALSTILDFATNSKASDIHIEPLEKELIVRCRVDGVLRKIMSLPKTIEPALVSRVKILSNLKIDEHRIPQDGQFTVLVDNKEVDLRIAISPVIWGEQVVIRILDKSGTTLDIEQMGMTGHTLRMVERGISRPNGMILTSGPTGSGKSTTLYALVKKIKSDRINIVTLEDPVEYKMEGVNQIQVNVDAGLTFATGLRSILRQDPDVVMVGEIRDAETANLAVQAALTGHLVFSTLHTNSAAGILPRMLDMGIEPFLLASTLNMVIGQRLVRRVAPKREAIHSNEIETKQINDLVGNILPQNQQQVTMVSEDLGYTGLPVVNPNGYTLVRGLDDRETPGGYKGRVGLYETIEVDDDIQKMIIAHSTSSEIMKMARQKGTLTMRQDGMMKALIGITTVSEVNRVASDLA